MVAAASPPHFADDAGIGLESGHSADAIVVDSGDSSRLCSVTRAAVPAGSRTPPRVRPFTISIGTSGRPTVDGAVLTTQRSAATTVSAPPSAPPPPMRERVLVALAIATAAGLLSLYMMQRPAFWPDFVYPWHAARLWSAGIDPYHAIAEIRKEPFTVPLYYPFPTVLAAWPVSGLPLHQAGAVFMASSCGLLAFLLTRGGWWRLWMLANPGLVLALGVGQFSPLLAAAAVVPAFGWFGMLKPNIGLALLASRFSWRTTLIMGSIGIASVLILPTWPLAWLHGLQTLEGHAPPVWGSAAVGLVALTRWRRSDARLLVAMLCVPQLLFFMDQLPLQSVARTRQEQAMLALMASLGFLAFVVWAWQHPLQPYVPMAQNFVLVSCYVPALVLIMRRPGSDGEPPVRSDLQRDESV